MPETIVKGVSDIAELLQLEAPHVPTRRRRGATKVEGMSREELEKLVVTLEEEMYLAAEELRFEYAAKLRDEIKDLRRDLTAMSAQPRVALPSADARARHRLHDHGLHHRRARALRGAGPRSDARLVDGRDRPRWQRDRLGDRGRHRGQQHACRFLGRDRELPRRRRPRRPLPALRPEAAAVGQGRVSLPRARLRRRGLPRAAASAPASTRNGSGRPCRSAHRRRCRRRATAVPARSRGRRPDGESGPLSRPARGAARLRRPRRRRVRRRAPAPARAAATQT